MNFDHSSQRVFRYELKSRMVSVQQSATEQEMRQSAERNGTDSFSACFAGWVDAGSPLHFHEVLKQRSRS